MDALTWTDAQFEQARQRGDPPVDALVVELHRDPAFGRLGFNHLLALANKLAAASELVLVNDSVLGKQLGAMPPRFVDYFDPAPVPAWVDEEQLQIASRLWEENSLGMLIGLYLASLPACYLMKHGIVALYDTGKLASPQYISQRVYETGLMVDAVLDPGGLKIVQDVEDEQELTLRALRQLAPDGDWKAAGPRAVEGKSAAPIEAVQLRRKRAELRRPPLRYVWGGGYVTVRKVRFLHASMRYLLTHTEPVELSPAEQASLHRSVTSAMRFRAQPWAAAENGLPVNQEDLAYTLLTFGYTILMALERVGCTFTLKERNAFLHLWKFVGHNLGIEDGLLPDNCEESRQLFEKIFQRQGGASEQGVKLTAALLDFLARLLPSFLCWRVNIALPPVVIADVLGRERAALLFDEPTRARADSVIWRLLWFVCRAGLHLYFFGRNLLLRHVPPMAELMGHFTHHVAEELIASCRDAFARQPFDVPKDASTWVVQYGVNEPFEKESAAWRQRVFSNFIGGLVALLAGGCLLAGAAVLLFWSRRWFGLIGAAGLIAILIGVWVLGPHLKRVVAARPQLDADTPPAS